MIAWVFFRSESLIDAYMYLFFIFIKIDSPNIKLNGLFFVLIILVIDWLNRKDEHNVLFFKK